jgi:hypothetical protein
LALITRKFLVTLCNSGNHRKAKQAGPYSRFTSGRRSAQFAAGANSSENENTLCRRFSKPQPLLSGRLTPPANSSTLPNAVQRLCTFLQNLAPRAIATTPAAPAAGLGRAGGCTALVFAQKRDAKPVGGRGISAFSESFFILTISSDEPGRARLRKRPSLGRCSLAA